MSAVRSVDHGYRALLERVFGFGTPEIAMGILAEQGSATKELPAGEGEPGQPVTLIQVAQWMEFGFEAVDGSDVPPRSFIRAWFDEASPKMREDLAKLCRAVLAGKRSKEEILELLGQRGQEGIQKRIADGIGPPLKQSTVDRKGSSKPLITTGQLRGGVSYAVRGDRGR